VRDTGHLVAMALVVVASFASVRQWLLWLLSPLLSVAANPQIPGPGASGQRDHWDH
jgi:hypothetical protein